MNRKKILLSIVVVIAVIGIFSIGFQPVTDPYSDGVLGVEIHVSMWHYRDGILLDYSHHAGVLTTLGANWIEDQLGDSPSTDPAKWIAVSNDAGSPSSAWIVIPTEITTGGMGRATGTYANVGDGVWNITKSFSPTGSGSCQLVGLYWASTGDYLLCADTISVINYENGDTVQIQWTITVS